jgi:DNA-binding LacI/PurR family transcriptional regulator
MFDVAARAGVSKSLVSLVLQGAPAVSAKRREAVLQAAAELGYRPNGLARRLVSGKTRACGVLVTDLHNPFYAEVLDGINTAARHNQFHALVVSAEHPSEASEAVEVLLELRVEGLLLIGSEMPAPELEELARQAHTVVVGAGPIDQYEGLDTIVNDDFLGAKLAVEHLARLGHRAIAHLCDDYAAAGRMRRAGYEAAMSELGLGAHVAVYSGDVTEQGGYSAAGAALEADPAITAIFVVNDLAAVGAYDAVEEIGLDVPTELSRCGYDNTFHAATHHLTLTTVSQPRRDMGELAVEALLERVGGRRRPKNQMLPPELVVRSSTARPRRSTVPRRRPAAPREKPTTLHQTAS